MITAVFTYRDIGAVSEMRLHMRGHAGYNPGNDIVCAAASILMQTLAHRLTEIAAHKADVRCQWIEDVEVDGHEVVMRVGAGRARERAKAAEAFAFAEDGMGMLREGYPANVNILVNRR